MEIRVIRGYVFYGQISTPEVVGDALKAFKAGYTQEVEADTEVALVRPEDGEGLPEWADDAQELVVITQDIREEYTEEWLVEQGYDEIHEEVAVVIAPINRQALFLGEI